MTCTCSTAMQAFAVLGVLVATVGPLAFLGHLYHRHVAPIEGGGAP